MTGARRQARTHGPRSQLEVVQVAPNKKLHRRLLRLERVKAAKKHSKHQKSIASRKTSSGRRQDARRAQRTEVEDDAVDDDELSEASETDHSAGRKRTRSPDGSAESGSETEEEQTRSQTSKQRRVEHQLVVGQSTPLDGRDAPSARRTPRTPSPARHDEPRPIVGCTPYKPEYDPAKPDETLERGYSPVSKKVVKAIKWPFKAYVATRRAFFSQDDADKYMQPILYDLLDEGMAGQKNRIARKDDGVYVPNILRNVRNTASKLRNHAFVIARPIVKVRYELNVHILPDGSTETEQQRGARVQELLTDFKFAAQDTETGDGMFEHPAIHEVISNALFHSTSPTFNIGAHEHFVEDFKSYPDGLIAFGAIAVYAALSEWLSGSWVKGKFEGRAYDNTFQELLDTLAAITAGEAESAVFAKKRADWYTDAWSRTALATVAHNAGNRNAIVMRNRLSLRAAHARETQADGAEAEPTTS